MKTVRFKTDFNWVPHPRQHIEYLAGWEGDITEACFNAASAAGALIEEEAPLPKRQKRDARRFIKG